MENINTCIVCGSLKSLKLYDCIDKVSSNEKFNIVYCQECSFQYTQNRPTLLEAGKYYLSDKYVSHTDNKKSFIISLYRTIRNLNLKWKLKIINKLNGNKNGYILDYGCGLGNFLSYCKENGWLTNGMDISEEARREVKKRYDINVYENKELFNTNKNKYDIITLWHVLEHVYNIDETIEGLKNSIKEEGYILIALPNNNSYDALKYKENWDAYDVPRHIWHFNKKSVEKLFLKHGLILIDTKPMVFDSYYVSIRSEMHKGNKFHFIYGMFWGFISHLKAIYSKEYSSQLYIFKKNESI